MIRKIEVVIAAVCLVLLGPLAFVGARTLLQVPENTESLEQVAQFTMRMCEQTNTLGAKQKLLWEYVIALGPDPAKPPETPAEVASREERTRQFREFLEETYPVRDCTP